MSLAAATTAYKEYRKSIKGETVVQWLTTWSHTEKVVSLVTNPWVTAWGFLGRPGFPPLSKNIHARPVGK